MVQINVVAAAIKNKNNQILCFQRGPSRTLENKWEFPGGKIEINETDHQALTREIKEELHANIKIGEFVGEASYDYEFGHVTMRVYFAELLNNAYQLTEHIQSQWIDAEKLLTIDWAPLDIPIAIQIKERLLDL